MLALERRMVPGEPGCNPGREEVILVQIPMWLGLLVGAYILVMGLFRLLAVAVGAVYGEYSKKWNKLFAVVLTALAAVVAVFLVCAGVFLLGKYFLVW